MNNNLNSAQQSTAAAAGGAGSINYEEKYRRLKKKYALLFQEHQKVLNEFEKTNEEMHTLSDEKQFLKEKIVQILSKSGFQVANFTEEEAEPNVKAEKQENNIEDSQLKQEDSAIQQE